jgi:hypothetical protein
MLKIFLDIKRAVHKEVALAGQTVNSAYYYDFNSEWVKMFGDFAPTLATKELVV